VVDVGAHVLPELCGFSKRADDNVDFPVVIKISEGTAAVSARKSLG